MLTNYLRKCVKNVAGNSDKLFVAKLGDIDSVTFDASNIVTGISMISVEDVEQKFAKLMTDLDSVQYTSSGTAQRGYYSEQSLIARFSQKSKELEATVEELLDGATCGLVVIRVDGNNRIWLSGIAPDSLASATRPWMSVQEEFDSGTSIEDSEEGNRYTITFSRNSATREYLITDEESGIGADILDGTATFINWD